MKKINLLSRAEMRSVLGGNAVVGADEKCVAQCSTGTVTCYPVNGGSCSATDNVGCKNFQANGYPDNGSLNCPAA